MNAPADYGTYLIFSLGSDIVGLRTTQTSIASLPLLPNISNLIRYKPNLIIDLGFASHPLLTVWTLYLIELYYNLFGLTLIQLPFNDPLITSN